MNVRLSQNTTGSSGHAAAEQRSQTPDLKPLASFATASHLENTSMQLPRKGLNVCFLEGMIQQDGRNVWFSWYNAMSQAAPVPADTMLYLVRYAAEEQFIRYTWRASRVLDGVLIFLSGIITHHWNSMLWLPSHGLTTSLVSVSSMPI